MRTCLHVSCRKSNISVTQGWIEVSWLDCWTSSPVSAVFSTEPSSFPVLSLSCSPRPTRASAYIDITRRTQSYTNWSGSMRAHTHRRLCQKKIKNQASCGKPATAAQPPGNCVCVCVDACACVCKISWGTAGNADCGSQSCSSAR